MKTTIDTDIATLVTHSYGKRNINVLVRIESTSGTTFKEMSISVELSGGFDSAYSSGDNSEVLPTDSLKAHVLALLENQRNLSLEDFGRTLLDRICQSATTAKQAKCILSERSWHPDVTEHVQYKNSAFTATQPNGKVLVTRLGTDSYVFGGEMNLNTLRPSESSFIGFMKDRYTRQKDVFERSLIGDLNCRWTYSVLPSDTDKSRSLVREVLQGGFANVSSRSVQETLHGMAVLLLNEVKDIDEVNLEFESIALKEHDGSNTPGSDVGVWLLSETAPSFTTAKLTRKVQQELNR